MLGAELAAADDTAADGEVELAAADDTAADGDTDLPAAPVSEAVVADSFELDATTTMTSAPNAMSPESTLCRAGQDLRFFPFGSCCGGRADCGCHGGGCAASC